MDAIELLENDHQQVKRLIEKLESQENAQGRAQLFETVRTEMHAHERIEEEIFYPALKQRATDKQIVLEGYEEHHVVDILMQELADLNFDDQSWPAKLKVMKENIEHHIEEEEDDMFSKARDVFSNEELEELGERMAARKKELEG